MWLDISRPFYDISQNLKQSFSYIGNPCFLKELLVLFYTFTLRSDLTKCPLGQLHNLSQWCYIKLTQFI